MKTKVMFTENDLQKLNEIGVSQSAIEEQLLRFETGFPALKIQSAASVEQGILQLSIEEQKRFEQIYNNFDGSITKFVPASGAASRMFKALFEAKEMLENGENINTVKNKNAVAKNFFDNLTQFAFYDEMKQYDVSTDLEILKSLLTEQGLNYGNLPKGVLLFHKYFDFIRTPFEEHLVEASEYAVETKTGIANLHFTVSTEHIELFKELFENVAKKYSKKYGIKYSISFSTQKKSTDIIAVNISNTPFRNTDGSLFFYPAGHGALLENLNEINSALVFIKNIDNVVPETKLAETTRWKKIIAGVLLDCKEKIHRYISYLLSTNDIAKTNEIVDFLRKKLCIKIPENANKQFLLDKLNRPIRVCGMVKNEGEPGGGPFIINENDGTTSLQILESSQIDKIDQHAMLALMSSAYFNPVDLVCWLKNYEGKKFNLIDFRDNYTGFISEKSHEGKSLKIQELPGLWNGAMSNWNTIFVEVPIETFNPVKTVTDLLRKQHQTFNN